jgi:branched-subunit amino acid aminotransferase/4-amino-4-deoxychorismate lyase
MKKTLFLNGKFIPEKDARISALTPGFLLGFGLFETMRSYNNKIVYFDQHLQRIKNSSQLIEMKLPYSIARLKEIIKETVRINGLKDAYVRLTLWKADLGAGILVMVKKYQPYSAWRYRRGFSIKVSRLRQDENSFLAGMKTTSRLLYELSLKEAKNKSFDEAIILNNRGFIAEGSRSNIFLVKDNRIFTPALECGCLDGITRRVIFDLAQKHNLKIQGGNFTPQDLRESDEAFLSNSLIGVMPAVSVDKYPIGKGRVGRITKFFMSKYHLLLKNGG